MLRRVGGFLRKEENNRISSYSQGSWERNTEGGRNYVGNRGRL